MKRELGRVYVTGADGFIGSHLVETLVSRGVEVTALCVYNSNSHYGWLDSYSVERPKNLNLILGDVRDPYFLDSTIAGHDTVFNLAALIAIPYSYQAPQSYFDTNVLGAIHVAQACLKNKVGRLVQTSTSEVYGTAQFVPITEKHPLQGQSPYSASKIGADMVVESYYRSFGLPAVILRPFNTYGPRQSLRAVIPTIIGQIVAGQERIRLGSLDPTRDFNFVSDTVEAFISIATSSDPKHLGQVFNAGSGREISIRDTALLIAKTLGKRIEIEEDINRLRPALSEVERLLADASKLTAATGWRPAVSLEQGLKRTADWMATLPNKDRSAHYHR